MQKQKAHDEKQCTIQRQIEANLNEKAADSIRSREKSA